MRHAAAHVAAGLVALLALTLIAGRAQAGVEDDIHQAEEARYDAMIRADGPALARVLADEFLYHQPSGKVATKESYIASFVSGDVKIKRAERYDVTIHVYGDVATAMGSTVVDVEMKGEARVVDLRYLNVWVLRDGRWQCVARQSAIKPK
ncbi:MAG TPA: nuclear transport factor 2 family protein [Burkholderiales bacterium]|jgi:ketosteroid isomerase-like protein|nr:nuclear transport factor 2 family protein [Burkholderiales bacterium]